MGNLDGITHSGSPKCRGPCDETPAGWTAAPEGRIPENGGVPDPQGSAPSQGTCRHGDFTPMPDRCHAAGEPVKHRVPCPLGCQRSEHRQRRGAGEVVELQGPPKPVVLDFPEVSPPGAGAALVPYPSARYLPRALVERATMLIVTGQGDRSCVLPPHQRALVAERNRLDVPVGTVSCRRGPWTSAQVDRPNHRSAPYPSTPPGSAPPDHHSSSRRRSRLPPGPNCRRSAASSSTESSAAAGIGGSDARYALSRGRPVNDQSPRQNGARWSDGAAPALEPACDELRRHADEPGTPWSPRSPHSSGSGQRRHRPARHASSSLTCHRRPTCDDGVQEGDLANSAGDGWWDGPLGGGQQGVAARAAPDGSAPAGAGLAALQTGGRGDVTQGRRAAGARARGACTRRAGCGGRRCGGRSFRGQRPDSRRRCVPRPWPR